MDPIADMLIKIKNASRAHKREALSVPYSRLKFTIAAALLKAGYLAEVTKKARKTKNILEFTVAFGIEGKPAVTDVKRLSKPSRRVYLGVGDIRPVRNGYGALLLSTPKGILTDREAKKEHVGGEVLFSIW